MDNRARAANSLKKFFESKSGGMPYFIATVKDVDKDTNTCTVVDYETTEWPLVRLKSSADAKKGFVLYPKKGSYVLVGKMKQDGSQLFIAMFSEIEQVQFVVGEYDFKEILKTLVDELVQLTVPTPSGVSSPPVRASAFTELKNKIDKMFK